MAPSGEHSRFAGDLGEDDAYNALSCEDGKTCTFRQFQMTMFTCRNEIYSAYCSALTSSLSHRSKVLTETLSLEAASCLVKCPPRYDSFVCA